MGLRSVRMSVTLSDLERPNGRHTFYHIIWQLSEPIVSNSLKLWTHIVSDKIVADLSNVSFMGDDARYLCGS